MLDRVRTAFRRKPLLGVAISVAIHAALIAVLVHVHPEPTPAQKRGDALIVELPNLPEPAAAGTPGPQADAPPVQAPKAAPAPKTAPAPKVAPTPPRPPVAARPEPKPATPDAPRAVASAPQPPPVADSGDVAAKSAPQPTPEAAKEPAPPVASAPPSPPGPVAMVPPSPPDLRSVFRRGAGGGGIGAGGAGGTGVGRGGILGEAIPLDSKDPDFSDYLERIRQLIKQNWGYPCVKNAETRECEYKTARLVVDFGILKHGPVQFVDIQRSSGWTIYDAYAVNAIKLASPFPPVPAGMMARVPNGSTGLPIRVNFTYMVETGVTNVIR